ncbi:histidine-trna ligase [Stylonychia lemnae]|uniref:histidine--tRNA ligase n=1 Tax=Stylonychia lemnae TaxID=5949 RepID=A0A078ASX9_STYLE|nr:histidine-trna ligase [Stylonychia lemnae]|eukprot:CDW85294.1 histidine-trna ligase [Stylonychia lemnae]
MSSSILKSSSIKSQLIKTAKGTRDMLPDQMFIKDKVLSQIKDIFKLHGAVEIDTPVFERREVFQERYGEANKLVYNLDDQGGELLSMRYDLTVPFARFMATHNIQKIKRFQIGKVYRRDQPNQTSGRYREFYQCDYDMAGQYKPMVADAEVLKVFCQQLKNLDLKFKIKLNDRRLLDYAIIEKALCKQEQFNSICTSLDKLDKEPWESVKEELKLKGLDQDQIMKIKEFIDIQSESSVKTLEQLRYLYPNNKILDEIQLLIRYLEEMDCQENIQLDPSLARGLDYYTGMIFEAVLTGEERNLGIGSIAAGGRYDNLLGYFSKNQSIPSAGGSLGIERIFNILEDRHKKSKSIINNVDVIIGSMGEVESLQLMRLASFLWDNNIKADIIHEKIRFKDQIQQAISKGAKYMIVLGEDELKLNKVLIKNLNEKSQLALDFEKPQIIEFIKKGL